MKTIPAMLSMSIALLFWGIVPLFLKYFTGILDPWTANGTRYAFSAGFWFPFVIVYLKKHPEVRRIWKVAWLPAAAHTICQMIYGWAPYYNSATMLNFGCRLSIPFTALFGFTLIQSERPLMKSPWFWVGLCIAMGAFFSMFIQGFEDANTSPTGLFILLCFAVTWGFYVVMVRRNLSGFPSSLAYGVVSLLACPLLVLAMFWMGDWHVLLELSGAQWGLLIISAMIGLALSHALFYHAIHILGPITSEAGMLLIPFITAISAWAIFDEHLSSGQWIAGGILLLGCALLITARLKTLGNKSSAT